MDHDREFVKASLDGSEAAAVPLENNAILIDHDRLIDAVLGHQFGEEFDLDFGMLSRIAVIGLDLIELPCLDRASWPFGLGLRFGFRRLRHAGPHFEWGSPGNGETR